MEKHYRAFRKNSPIILVDDEDGTFVPEANEEEDPLVDIEDVREFMTRLVNIENEMDILKDDRKTLFDEFKDKLDTKAFRAALSIYKIRLKNVDSTDTIETMVDILEE